MISPKHCRAILVLLFGNLFMVACTGTQQEVPMTERDHQKVRNRTVPEDGRLVATSRIVKNDFGLRATWEIETTSDNQNYFQWLKSQLGPEYHVTAETSSNVTLIEETLTACNLVTRLCLQAVLCG
jgi:hypothetical protein